MSLKHKSFLLLAVLIFFAAYHYGDWAQYWQRSLIALQHWQNDYRREMTALMRQMRSGGNAQTWWLLLSAGFMYGILHAAGPGHGKAVISTFLLTQRSDAKQALGLAVGGALLQGLSAILWVGITIGGLQWLMRDALKQVIWAERLSYALLIVTGGYLLYKALRQWITRQSKSHTTCTCCGCGGHHHEHHALPLESCRAYWGALAAIALRPCSGSILALAVASAWQLWAVGIAMTLAISIGTALTVLSLALLTLYGRARLAERLPFSSAALQAAASLLAMLGGIILILLGLLFLLTTQTPLPLGI